MAVAVAANGADHRGGRPASAAATGPRRVWGASSRCQYYVGVSPARLPRQRSPPEAHPRGVRAAADAGRYFRLSSRDGSLSPAAASSPFAEVPLFGWTAVVVLCAVCELLAWLCCCCTAGSPARACS